MKSLKFVYIILTLLILIISVIFVIASLIETEGTKRDVVLGMLWFIYSVGILIILIDSLGSD